MSARDFIRGHPGAFLTGWARRLGYFWWLSPMSGGLYPARWRMLYLGYYVTCFVAALFGTWSVWRAQSGPRAAVLLFWGMMAAVAVAQSLFYVEGRHRWGVEPLLILLAIRGGLELLHVASASRITATAQGSPGIR